MLILAGYIIIAIINGYKPPITVVSVAFAVAVAVAVTVTFAVAVTGAVIFTAIGTGALTFAAFGTGTVIFAAAGTGAVAVTSAAASVKFKPYLFIVSILYFVAVYALAKLLPEFTQTTRNLGLLVGLVLFPLVNAPFDYLSTGLTRYLLRQSRDASSWLKRTALSIADLFAALLLLVLLAISLVVVMEAFNSAAGQTIINVKALLTDLRENPLAGRHWWIYFALFSTLFPTIIHAACWALSFIRFQLPQRHRVWMVAQFDNNFEAGNKTRFWVLCSLTFQMTTAFILPLLAIITIILFIFTLTHLGETFINTLFWTQKSVAALF